MENLFRNVTYNSSKPEPCQCRRDQIIFLSLVDIVTFLIGQPVIVRLLWITFTSNKAADILNGNLAVFHNFQYLISLLHLIVLFVLPHHQAKILRFLFVYAQIGGPTNLSFICVQRYVAVIYPTSYPLLKKYRYCEVCAVTVWILSVPTAFASVIAANASPSPRDKTLNTISLCVMVFMISMMGRCSIRIVRMLMKRGPGRDKLHPAKKRAFKTITATSTITLLFYIPVTMLQRFMLVNGCAYDCVLTPRCIFLLSAASIVHPLFYLSTQRKLFTCLKQEKEVQ